MRTITAEQYRTMQGGSFDEVFANESCMTEVWDVAIHLDENDQVVLGGPFGSIPVDQDRTLYVR